jgi:hypothetical protein
MADAGFATGGALQRLQVQQRLETAACYPKRCALVSGR